LSSEKKRLPLKRNLLFQKLREDVGSNGGTVTELGGQTLPVPEKNDNLRDLGQGPEPEALEQLGRLNGEKG